MSDVFFTYVWGAFGDKGGPLTFTSKANRTTALNDLKDGDFVVGIISRTPGDPRIVIHEDDKGRVGNVWQISRRTADTADYGIEAHAEWDRTDDGSYRWPYALQPIRTWLIEEPPEFRALPGYTNATHTQKAITSVQRVDDALAVSLMALLEAQGKELEPLEPRLAAMSGAMRKLRQRHPFALNAYDVHPDADALHYIYVATLGPNSTTLKIGHSADPKARIAGFNTHRLASERQWELAFTQPMGVVQKAISAERALGIRFDEKRTEPNNGEVFHGLDAGTVISAIVDLRTALT